MCLRFAQILLNASNRNGQNATAGAAPIDEFARDSIQ